MFFLKIKNLFINRKVVQNFYTRYENHISSGALLLGFIVDNLTLTKVDALTDRIVLLTYLAIVCLCIVLLSVYENGTVKEKVAGRAHFWLLFAMQFAFGGMFSAFIVFYTRGATFESAWPFLLLLLGYFAANEIFKKAYLKLNFRLSVLFFAILSLCLLIVPSVVKKIGDGIFLLSCAVAIALFTLMMVLLRFISNEQVKSNIWSIRISVGAILLGVISLYYANAIPPLPLILKSAGVYHNLIPLGNGGYSVYEEKESFWLSFFNSKKTFHKMNGEYPYVVTAVYSPVFLNTFVIHNWEYFDTKKEEWVSQNKVHVFIKGGREDGYRLYSYKPNAATGLWRVNVETREGKLIGRLKFEIIEGEGKNGFVFKNI